MPAATVLSENLREKQLQILPSAARTATAGVVPVVASGYTYLYVFVDLTAFTTAASIALQVYVRDPVTTKIRALLQPAAITANNTYLYAVGRDLPTTGIDGISDASPMPLPENIEIEVTHGNSNSHTYSVGAILIR